MKKRKDCFLYSEKNEYPLAIPPEIAVKIERKGRKRRKNRIAGTRRPLNFMWVVRLLAVVVLIVAAVILGKRVYEYARDFRYSEVQNDTIAVRADTGEEIIKRDTPVYPEFEGKTVETGRFDYPQLTDSEKLTQFSLAYPDFVFWILIENTSVNYPVVQAPDNSYYLRRNMDGEDNISGTLFLDYRNNRETMKGNNIVYGHNNQNGTMFGLLRKYLSKSYYDSHPVIYTYTGDSVTMWRIFSAYETDVNNYYIATSFYGEEDYGLFLQKLKNDSAYDTGVEISSSDDILTLSTCHSYTSSNGRFVVHAVRVGETPLR